LELEKATKSLEHSQSDREEEKALNAIANKISSDEELESNAITKIRDDEKA